MTEADVVRELAHMELELEPDVEDQAKLVDDDEFDREATLLAAGRYDEIGLDDLPADWKPTTMEDLRRVDG